MVDVLMTHEVKNYADWKKGFDSDSVNREKMGVKISSVLQCIENPNKVSVISQVPSMEAIKGFLASPDMKATMEKAGVIGTPSVKILNNI
jgi:hypothetical protein